MFKKIKGKLKGVFSKSEDEIFEDTPVEKEELIDEDSKTKLEEEFEKEAKDEIEEEFIEEESKEKKKGFFGRIFSKDEEEKESEDEQELEKLEEDMLEGVSKEEKVAIKKHTDIPKEIVEQRKEEVEAEIQKEEVKEKEELVEVKKEKELKKDKKKEVKLEVEKVPEPPKLEEEPVEELVEEFVEEEKKEDSGFFSKTFGKLASKKISESDFEKIWLELEIFLLEINIAYEIVQKIEEKLRESIIDEKFNRFSLSHKIRDVMVDEVKEVMISRESDLLEEINKINDKGEIARIVVLGVNGTGKTTTIAKFVNYLQKHNKSLVVAAADTFRAAAVEQLDEHSKKVGFKLIQHKGGSDPAAVAFDAIEHAKAKKLDVVIVDTAGRMPNNSNLMQELAKIERVTKADINLFVGDSISGNDLVEQIELFDKVVGINGMILTKTDTDERPGSVVTAAYTIDKPIYYLGIGQDYDDLIKFDAGLVAEKLFELDEEE